MYCVCFQTKSSKTVHLLMRDRRMNAYGVRLKSHFNSRGVTACTPNTCANKLEANLCYEMLYNCFLPGALPPWAPIMYFFYPFHVHRDYHRPQVRIL